MKIVPPCKDCPDRHLGCHDKCEKYQAFKKESLDYKTEVNKAKSQLAYFGKKAKENAERKRRKHK